MHVLHIYDFKISYMLHMALAGQDTLSLAASRGVSRDRRRSFLWDMSARSSMSYLLILHLFMFTLEIVSTTSSVCYTEIGGHGSNHHSSHLSSRLSETTDSHTNLNKIVTAGGLGTQRSNVLS